MFHHSGVNKHTIAMKEINDSAGIATAAKTMLITRSTFFLETTWFPFFIIFDLLWSYLMIVKITLN